MINIIDLVYSAIVLGWKRQIWPLTAGSIWGSRVEPDTQLAFMGLVNKIMDYLLTYCIEHMAVLILTTWMTQPSSSSGVVAIDLELSKELLRPWVALEHFITRWRSHNIGGHPRSKLVTLLRFFVALACSVCFLVSAAAMNTLGLAKSRWYPDDWPNSIANNALMTMLTPRMSLVSVDWSNYRYMGMNTVNNGSQWSVAAVAIASASTYMILASLDEIYQPPPRSWRGMTQNHTYITSIDTNIAKSGVKSISVQASYVSQIYDTARYTGPSYARSSTGMIGAVTLTVPMLTTVCNAGTATNLSSGIALSQTSRPAAPDRSLMFQIGSNAERNFSGATCSLILQQMLFPFQFWLRDHEGLHFDSSQNASFRLTSTISPASAVDEANLQRLAGQFSAMLPHLNGLLPNSSFAEHLILAARRLQQKTLGFETEIDSLAPVVALTMQHLLTTAVWTMAASPTENITSFPIRWYVYGSGPRLEWQWVTGAVFAILILVLSYDVYLMLCYRIAPGPWLKLHGMMIAANAATKMHSVRKGCAGVAGENGQKTRYFVREVREGEAEIVDDADKGAILERGKFYGEAEERQKQMMVK
jgi:hypothetical protein